MQEENSEVEEHPMRQRDKGKARATSMEGEGEVVGEEPVLRARPASRVQEVGQGVNKTMRGGHWAYTVCLG